MIFRVCLAFFFVVLFVPFGMGKALLKKQGALLSFICGFAASLLYFEILMLIFHALGANFRVMVWLWSIPCGLAAVYGIFQSRHHKAAVAMQKKGAWDAISIVLFAAVLLLTAGITLNTVFNTTYVNWDDQTYVANAVGTWQTDLVNRVAPYSGSARAPFYDRKYVIAGWPIYSSMLAVLSGIHPAIIFRTLLPLFEIPAAIGIIYLLLKEFFPKSQKKALLGVVYYLFFALAVSGKMEGDCSEWWLFVNCWTGKALSFNIVIPLVLWLLLRLEKEPAGKTRTACWITLFLVGGAACNIAATMFMILPIEIGAWGIFSLYRTRRWSDIWKYALSAAPAVLCAIVTL